MATCVESLPSLGRATSGHSLTEIVAQPSTFMGKRIRVTGTLFADPGSALLVLSDVHAGRPSVFFTVMPAPSLIERCGGHACVTLEATPVMKPANPLIFDGESGELRDVALLARSETCERPPEFINIDRNAVEVALRAIAQSVGQCKTVGGPVGEGHVTVILYGDGRESVAVVDRSPYARTEVGSCIEQLFRRAHVQPFSGVQQFGKAFTIR